MSEFCLEHWSKINETQDLCEECGQYKRVIVVERFWSRAQRVLAEAIENIQKQSKK